MEEVYVYYSCDQWKSKDSMSLIGIFTDKNILIKKIKEDLVKGHIQFYGTIEQFEKGNISELNNNIEYGHIDVLSLNKAI